MAITPAEAAELLELPAQWSKADLKNAFKKAAMKHHPDRGGDELTMKKVNASYKLLQKTSTIAGGSYGSYKASKAAHAVKMEKVYRSVAATVNNLFDPEKYASYFHKQTGKVFHTEVKDAKHNVNYFIKNVEWVSADKETVFVLHLRVDLVGVKKVKSLGGAGGEPALAFSILLMPEVLHNNRKSKMRKKNWDFSTKQESLVDPTKVFPKSSIKKMMAGKDTKRKFSKRDMLTAIKHKLKGDTNYSGKDIWVMIPVGDYELHLYRTTFMGSALWDLHSVRAKVDGKWKTFRSKSSGYFPEREVLIDILHKIQKHNWSDPQALVDTTAHQMTSAYKHMKESTEELLARLPQYQAVNS